MVTFFVQNIGSEYQSWLWSGGGLILCIYGLVYYKYVSEKSTHVVLNPHLGCELNINNGIFVYFSFSLVLFILMNYIMTELDPYVSRLMWSIHNVNNIIKNIFFGMGLYYSGKRHIGITEEKYESVIDRD
jgi:hypothetical protein